MAIYVSSDLHGYPLSDFLKNLKQTGFCDEDWLYILGDVIDRNGDGGVEMLRWLLYQPNVVLLRGNHEQMLLDCAWLFENITEESIDELDEDKMKLYARWQMNGCAPTIESMKRLLHSDEETALDILDYLGETPLCETLEVGGRAFVLCHGGFKGFDKGKRLSDYDTFDIVWNRPLPTDRYFDDAITIIGHTMTDRYGCPERAFHTETWIDIDVGGSVGRPPMLLRLDDMKEFYFDR